MSDSSLRNQKENTSLQKLKKKRQPKLQERSFKKVIVSLSKQSPTLRKFQIKGKLNLKNINIRTNIK